MLLGRPVFNANIYSRKENINVRLYLYWNSIYEIIYAKCLLYKPNFKNSSSDPKKKLLYFFNTENSLIYSLFFLIYWTH